MTDQNRKRSPGASASWLSLAAQPLWAGGAILAFALLAYHNSFHGPFIYDDVPSIVDNPTIRQLWPPWNVLLPPNDSGVTVNGRPVVNLSLAINHAIGGNEVFGYHVLNFLIHAAASLALFGLVRRTLQLPQLQPRFQGIELGVAAGVAAVWVVHPLDTESVTYVIQRAEALVGLFLLLTCYGFARSIQSPGSRLWPTLTVMACLCGMASKEVMVSAPLLLLLYDRTFAAGSFKEAWRTRRRLYLALASTWILLALLVWRSGSRGGTAGFGAGGLSSWHYALTQCRAIVQYIKLTFWPEQLIFDYGVEVDRSLGAVAPQAVLVVALVVSVVVALWRWPVFGFLGAWFLAILAPSTSFLPIATEAMAEHRMYLPIIALLVVPVAAARKLLSNRMFLVVGVLVVSALAGLTISRNRLYQSELLLWEDTVRKWPRNSRGHNNLGEVLFRSDDRANEAIAAFQEALRRLPGYGTAASNLGNALVKVGRVEEALPFLRYALKLAPDSPEALKDLGSALYRHGDEEEAIEKLERCLQLKPDFADAHNNLSVVLAARGRNAEAASHCEAAIRLKPGYADAYYNYGNSLRDLGRTTEAIAQFNQSLSIKPDYAEAHCNLANLLLSGGETDAAIHHYREAIRLKPDYADARNNHGVALVSTGRLQEARAEFEQALKINPAHADARRNLQQLTPPGEAKR